MKKLLSILCAAVMLISPYNVYATEVLGDGSATTTVIGHVDSQYCVMIPETIVADGNLYYFTASLMDLAEGDVVNISVDGVDDAGNLAMSGGDGNAYAIIEANHGSITNLATIAQFHNGETTSSTGISATLQNAYRAGDYSGTLTINIQLAHED